MGIFQSSFYSCPFRRQMQYIIFFLKSNFFLFENPVYGADPSFLRMTNITLLERLSYIIKKRIRNPILITAYKYLTTLVSSICYLQTSIYYYSTVTLFARFCGLSTSRPSFFAIPTAMSHIGISGRNGESSGWLVGTSMISS